MVVVSVVTVVTVVTVVIVMTVVTPGSSGSYCSSSSITWKRKWHSAACTELLAQVELHIGQVHLGWGEEGKK